MCEQLFYQAHKTITHNIMRLGKSLMFAKTKKVIGRSVEMRNEILWINESFDPKVFNMVKGKFPELSEGVIQTTNGMYLVPLDGNKKLPAKGEAFRNIVLCSGYFLKDEEPTLIKETDVAIEELKEKFNSK